MNQPRDEGRYALVPKVTLASLDSRLTNVERILLRIESTQTPRWLKASAWTTIVGSILGVAVKVMLSK
jgi:hypothetical protein